MASAALALPPLTSPRGLQENEPSVSRAGQCQAVPNKGAFGVPGAGMSACGRGEGTGHSSALLPVASAPATLHCLSTSPALGPAIPA